MYLVGVDWADQKHDVGVINEAGEKILTLSFPHNHTGCAKLKEQLLKISPNAEDFACIVETNNGLLVQFLVEAGFPVYPINPKMVDGRRKPSGAKTDPLDAMILADIGRTELRNLRRLKPSSELLQELKVLTRDQDTLIQDSTRLLNRLTACLKEYYPVALHLFSKLTSPVTVAFLKTFPCLHDARRADVPTIAAFLKQHKHPKPNQKAIEIYSAVHEPQLEASAAVTRGKMRLMVSLVAQLETLLENIADYDKEIERLFTQHSDSRIFASLPGAGKRLAPRLLVECGEDRERFEKAEVLQALAGTSPVVWQSGKMLHVRQRQACNKQLRRVMYQLAFQTIGSHGVAWAREYYDKKRKMDKKSHSEAIRQLSNTWIRVVFAIWKAGTTYDEELFLAARQRHARAA